MRILLIDADSVIPNLALMKLSAHHKSQGHSVELIKLKIPYYPNKKKTNYTTPPTYDKIYCSVIFEGNKDCIKGEGIIFGGTGFDLKTELPENIENLDPDYSIYPDNDMSYGFITRGCIRNCYFCKVPAKEGFIHRVSSVGKIIKHKKVSFLDNNILAHEDHYSILQELIDKNIRCRFEQGLDIRLLNSDNSYLLSQLNYMNEYAFAFDNIRDQKNIEEKIALLKWSKPWGLKFYIYVNPDMPLCDTIRRINWCKEHKVKPYIMRDITCWGSKHSDFYTDLAAYCNQPAIFKNLDFYIFRERRSNNKERYKYSTELWRNNQ